MNDEWCWLVIPVTQSQEIVWEFQNSSVEKHLSKGILEAIDMDSYRTEKRSAQKILLPDEDAEIDPVPISAGGGKPEPELDRLSNIIKIFNDQLGNISWDDADRVHRLIIEEIPARKNSDKQNARIEHDKALVRVIENGGSAHLHYVCDLYRDRENRLGDGDSIFDVSNYGTIHGDAPVRNTGAITVQHDCSRLYVCLDRQRIGISDAPHAQISRLADAVKGSTRRLVFCLGGAGKWRGGDGQEVVFCNDTGHLLEFALMGQRTEYPAKGLQGGGDGILRLYEVNGQLVDPKSRVELSPGDRISMREAGGGGFGSAAERRR